MSEKDSKVEKVTHEDGWEFIGKSLRNPKPPRVPPPPQGRGHASPPADSDKKEQ